MKKFLLTGIIVFLGFSSPCFACDVNLVAIITGEQPSDAFGQMVTLLASETRAIGQNYENAEASQVALKTLMKSWMEFDNKFSQTPPDWAKSDPSWSKKIKEMADMVGGFQKPIKERNEQVVHDNVLNLFRRLIALFEKMPMSDFHKALVRVSSGFSTLFEANEAKDPGVFGLGVASLSTDLKAIKPLLPEPQKNALNEVEFEINLLSQMTHANPASITNEMRTRYTTAENAFKAASIILRGPVGAAKEEKDAH